MHFLAALVFPTSFCERIIGCPLLNIIVLYPITPFFNNMGCFASLLLNW